MPTPEDPGSALAFGGADGLTSALGILLGIGLRPGITGATVFAAAVGVAVAELVGMSAGAWLEDGTRPHRAALIGLGSFTAAALPATPFLILHGRARTIAVVVLVLAVAVTVAWARPPRGWFPHTWIKTFGVLLVAGGLTAVVSLFLPS